MSGAHSKKARRRAARKAGRRAQRSRIVLRPSMRRARKQRAGRAAMAVAGLGLVSIVSYLGHEVVPEFNESALSTLAAPPEIAKGPPPAAPVPTAGPPLPPGVAEVLKGQREDQVRIERAAVELEQFELPPVALREVVHVQPRQESRQRAPKTEEKHRPHWGVRNRDGEHDRGGGSHDGEHDRPRGERGDHDGRGDGDHDRPRGERGGRDNDNSGGGHGDGNRGGRGDSGGRGHGGSGGGRH